MYRLTLWWIALACVSVSCSQGGPARPPAVAGSFYERTPFALDAQVDRLLAAADRSATTGSLMAAVVPHAGYVFSGRCAASVYSLISSGMFERVIILAPSHHVYLTGACLPDPDLTAYATPLGNVPIDRDLCNALRREEGFVSVPDADAKEHAIEVHLPLLQKTARSFSLVPLVCGRMEAAQIDAVATVLAGYCGTNTLLVASSDFTHYGPNYNFVPFSDEVPRRLQSWLNEAAGRIAALDGVGFDQHCRDTHDTICGETPIRILLATMAHSVVKLKGQVLNTATSGELTGNYDNSVSYASIGFFREPKEDSNRLQNEDKTARVAPRPPEHRDFSTFVRRAPPGPEVIQQADRTGLKEPRPADRINDGKETTRQEEGAVKEHRSGDWTPGLTDAEKKTLFALARDTLKWCVGGGKGKFSFEAYDITPVMKVNTATFVTLKIQGGLRGCIGSLAPVEPLYLSVHDNAVNAALRDPRFEPVRPAELSRIEVDVSILSPIRDIPSLKDFKIGQHGIILQKGMSRAVYLPEVATEQGWTVEETLSSLSMKAGLPPDAWRQGATFKVFESIVLSE